MNVKILFLALVFLICYPLTKQQQNPNNTHYWISLSQLQSENAISQFCAIDSVVYQFTMASTQRIPKKAPADTLYLGKGHCIDISEIHRYYRRKLVQINDNGVLKDSIVLVKNIQR